jgi:signal-transduction protein with cAMP-binding, CBS, and nucleotidyltransferase domain
MSDDEVYHPHETILSEAALETLSPFGEERSVGRGEVVYRAGEPSHDFFVVVDGTVELVLHGLDGDVVVASFFSGECLGELNLVTGQRACLTARVAEPGKILSIRRQLPSDDGHPSRTGGASRRRSRGRIECGAVGIRIPVDTHR